MVLNGEHKLTAVALGIIALASCSGRTSVLQAVKPVHPEPPAVVDTPGPEIFNDGKVTFENVTFIFDRNLIDKVEASVLPAEKLESEDIKPDGIGGRTLEFALNYLRSEDKGFVSVFKLAEYKAAFAKFPHYLGQDDSILASLIAKPSTITRRGIEQPVHVRWMDAHHDFYARAQIVNFKGGRGLLMLTQIGQDAYNAINSDQLEYFFQGITDDGVYFVEMSFPADMDGLPKGASEEWLKLYHSPEAFSDPKHEARYRKYAMRVTKEIDLASDNRFDPSPKMIRKFIGSSQIN